MGLDLVTNLNLFPPNFAILPAAARVQPRPCETNRGFWAPFLQRVAAGLRELPMVPVRGRVCSNGGPLRLPMSRCRKPESPLLAQLGCLGVNDWRDWRDEDLCGDE